VQLKAEARGHSSARTAIGLGIGAVPILSTSWRKGVVASLDRKHGVSIDRTRYFSLGSQKALADQRQFAGRAMVYVHIYGLECGTAGDAVILRAELVYAGGAGSIAGDADRDWKPDAKVAAAAKAAVGGTKMWKSAFKTTVHAGVGAEGGPASVTAFLQGQEAAMAVLEKHGLAGSLKTSGESPDASSPAWCGVKVKADPTGLTMKKLVEELRSTAC
jgi:hypothetical protein